MIWNEILCLGDSITCGARDEYGRSYPIELARILTDRTGEAYVCHEHAVCGETSADLLKRAWDNTAKRPAARIALVLIGTNDTASNIPVEIYEDNIRQIVKILKIHGKHIIFGLLPKLEFTPIYYKNASLIDEYNKVLKKLSHELNFELCDMSGTEKYYIDGVHYTNEGYCELAHRWAEKILAGQT